MALVFFPMWQGMGHECTLQSAAGRLASHIASDFGIASDVEIAVSTHPALPVQEGVFGLQVISDQLATARQELNVLWPERIALLGGDCGIEVASIGWLNERHEGDLLVVWFDAHADLNTPASSPSGAFHGMPLRTLFGEGPDILKPLVPRPLSPDQVVMVGVREFDPPEAAYTLDHHITQLQPQRRPEHADALLNLIASKPEAKVYLHFDLDVLDEREFPYVAFRSPTGLGIEPTADLLTRIIDRFQVVGMSLTEYAEPSGAGLSALTPLLGQFARVARG